MIRVKTPLTKECVRKLKAGDKVLLSGIIYTARDAAHKRMIDFIEVGKELPIPIENSVLYYAGPTPPKPGRVIGSIGPTTSYRMDDYAVELIQRGLKGMIGKGKRSKEVIDSMKKNNAVYFAAVGGAGALISDSIKACEIVAFEDLGTEAIRKLVVQDFPVIVVIDSQGNNLYETEPRKYRRKEDNNEY